MPDVLTADELLTMELYVQREGALTPEQARRLLTWAKAFRHLIEGQDSRRVGSLRGEF